MHSVGSDTDVKEEGILSYRQPATKLTSSEDTIAGINSKCNAINRK
jgi:hypothetical protein